MSRNLTTEDMKNYIKGLLPEGVFNRYYCNLLNKNNPVDKQVGVYYTKDNLSHISVDYGCNIDRYTEGFTILIRGTDNYQESLDLSRLVLTNLYNDYYNKETLKINDINIYTIQFLTDLIDVSDFENENVYEFTINIVICYEYSLD